MTSKIQHRQKGVYFVLRLSRLLGWSELKQMYQRTVLGQFWITLGMAVSMLAIGVIFGLLFESPITKFLPFIASGLIIWTFMSSVITEGTNAFIVSSGFIRQIAISKMTYFLKAMWKQLFVLGHNIVILPFVLIIFGINTGFTPLLAIPGFLLTFITLGAVSLILGVTATRFRDLPQIIVSALSVIFYITPVIWDPTFLTGSSALRIIELNPLFHLLQIVRLPLIGQLPTGESWIISVIMAVVVVPVAIVFFKKYEARISYWV